MTQMNSIGLYAAISEYIEERRGESDLIAESRKAELRELAAYIRERLKNAGSARLTFICTHNSRRSHLSQIWAKVAADAQGLSAIETYSGGTEATALNPRVVASLRRTGFIIESPGGEVENPRYQVRYAEGAEAAGCFSKRFDQAPNPTSEFCAIMTCSSADEACPLVPGCELRLAIRYEDPKASDGTAREAATYDERSRQICREMMYAMLHV